MKRKATLLSLFALNLPGTLICTLRVKRTGAMVTCDISGSDINFFVLKTRKRAGYEFRNGL